MRTKFILESLNSRKKICKTDLTEKEWDSVDWFELVQDTDRWGAHVCTVLNLFVP
jgi:hypothetical protein